ncbi:Alpha/Beta hydrolase protein [Entophlyctis helioformis]|nr:Alpha/Beta hydrolase protein [Entophlyctis helioformis]
MHAVTDSQLAAALDVVARNGRIVSHPACAAPVHVVSIHRDSPLCVVFLHGLTGQASGSPSLPRVKELGCQMAAIDQQQTHSVLAFDYVGHGLSHPVDALEPYLTANIVKAAMALIETLAPKHASQFIMVGHSYGCTIASRISLEWTRRDQVLGLVLMSPKSETTDKEREFFASVPKYPAFVFSAYSWLDSLRGASSGVAKGGFAANSSKELRLFGTDLSSTMSGIARKNVMAGVTFAGEEVYTKVTAPILLIGGIEDPVAPPTPNITGIAQWAKVPESNVHILENASHQVMLEKASAVNGLLLAFIAERLEAAAQ